MATPAACCAFAFEIFRSNSSCAASLVRTNVCTAAVRATVAWVSQFWYSVTRSATRSSPPSISEVASTVVPSEPPHTRIRSSCSVVWAHPRRATRRGASGAQASVVGSKPSVVSIAAPSGPDSPPQTTALPSDSADMEWQYRGQCNDGAGAHSRLVGSYVSHEARICSPLCPPVTSTRPSAKVTCAQLNRAVRIGGLAVQTSYCGSYTSTVARGPVTSNPPQTITSPLASVDCEHPCRGPRIGLTSDHLSPRGLYTITFRSSWLQASSLSSVASSGRLVHPPQMSTRPSAIVDWLHPNLSIPHGCMRGPIRQVPPPDGLFSDGAVAIGLAPEPAEIGLSTGSKISVPVTYMSSPLMPQHNNARPSSRREIEAPSRGAPSFCIAQSSVGTELMLVWHTAPLLCDDREMRRVRQWRVRVSRVESVARGAWLKIALQALSQALERDQYALCSHVPITVHGACEWTTFE
eukprot:m.127298 g.127298  ORF g.127298 m.127298 type:complete len:465 (+) comp22220_c0_seq3:1059-2453(+)